MEYTEEYIRCARCNRVTTGGKVTVQHEDGRVVRVVDSQWCQECRDPVPVLKLFVWEDVLQDYTSGVMFALAPDVETARKLLREQCYYLPEADLQQEPAVYTEPFACSVWGGG